MKRLGKRSYTILSDSGQRHGNDHLAILIGYYDERAGKHITVNLTSDPETRTAKAHTRRPFTVCGRMGSLTPRPLS